MKSRAFAVACIVLSALAPLPLAAQSGNTKAPAPIAPIASLRLPDGRIFRNATLANFTAETVLIRHAAGSAVVRYEFFPDDLRAQAEQRRPGGPRYYAGDTAKKQTTVAGQIFITTRGVGAYKFSSVPVYAFAIEHLKIWEHATRVGPVELPKPIAETVTDGDGRFTLKVPEGEQFFIFAQASRLLSDGSKAFYEWRAPSSEIKKFDHVMLESEWRHQFRQVKIEKVE